MQNLDDIKLKNLNYCQNYRQLTSNLRPVHTLPQAAGRRPHRVEHISTFSVFPLISQRNFQQFHLRAACVLT